MPPQGNPWAYSARPDGQRFLVNKLADTGQCTVNATITHWQQKVADAGRHL